VEVHPTGLAADFYGRVLLALAVGALAGAVGRALVGRASLEAQRRWLKPVLAWSAGLLLFTAGLYVFLLVGRQPFAAPLPPGYVPR
jgi:hypothetical protein